MKETILKFAVKLDPEFCLDLPIDAKVLCVQSQREIPQMWVRLQPDAPKIKRKFLIIGTGQPFFSDFGETIKYIGTFQIGDGALIWHLFEAT